MTETESRTTETMSADVIVVGAGPAGLFAALALHNEGFRPVVVGPLPEGRRDHRTSALLDGSVLALKRLGVWPHLESKAAPLRVMRLSTPQAVSSARRSSRAAPARSGLRPSASTSPTTTSPRRFSRSSASAALP